MIFSPYWNLIILKVLQINNMDMKFFIFRFLLIFFLYSHSCIIWAQHVKGRVTDESGVPLEYASVMIVDANDSTLIAGCVTNAGGEFEFERMYPKELILRVKYIGYEDHKRLLSHSVYDVGIIKMKPSTSVVGEVIVKGSKPLFQTQNGSLVTNVAGTVLSQTHEMGELVAQIPGIVKTADGGFEVFGSGSPIIYVNNKKVQDVNELRLLSPKEIKSIELITNPGAKYDAEGKSVLRIVTLKKEDGFALQAGGNAKQNDDTSYGGDLKVAYKRDKINLSASYGYSDGRNRSNLPQNKTLFIGEDTHSFAQDQKAKGKLTSHEWKLNADYEINDRHNVGFEWDASRSKDKENRSSLLDYTLNGSQVKSTGITNDYQNDINFNHLNIFHNGRWGKHLTTELNLDYANNNNDYRQNTSETTNRLATETQSKGRSTLDIYAGKLAFGYDLVSGVDISWGLEYNHISGSGRISTNSSSVPSSDYENKEDKYAIYAELNAQIGNFGVNGGIRYEDLVSDYDDHIDKDGNVHRHYRNIYPSLSLSHSANGWSNTLSFSSRTTRPSFRQLSNSSYYANEFMYQRGNPLLKPSNSYIVQWRTGYKFLNFSASYTQVDDYISTDFYVPERTATQVVSSYSNFDKIQYFKASLTLQKAIAWWRPSFTIGLNQPFFHYEFRGEKMSYNKAQVYFLANQYFTLPKSYLLSVYYYLNSGGNQGAVELKSFQMLNMGLQKSFFDGKLSVSLNARDIFHTMKYKETERIRNLLFRQTEDYCLWNYSISLIYRLNKNKAKYRGKTSIREELERL